MMTSNARKASEVGDDFPYGWPGRVCYFTVKDGEPQQLLYRDDMRTAKNEGAPIWAVWPGQWRSDLFAIDEPERLPK
jgi:hypothetical protein